jgi:hypothetical protein
MPATVVGFTGDDQTPSAEPMGNESPEIVAKRNENNGHGKCIHRVVFSNVSISALGTGVVVFLRLSLCKSGIDFFSSFAATPPLKAVLRWW